MITKIVKQEIVGQYKIIQTALQEYQTIDGIEQPIGSIKRLPAIAPGDDISNIDNIPQEVIDLINFLHTPELIAEYQNKDNPDLAQVKTNKLKLIAQQRYAHETSGLAYNNHIIRTDRASVQTLDSYINKLNSGKITSIEWKCVNSWLVIDNTNADEIELLIITYIATAFAKEKQAENDINALTTIDDVNNYTISW